MQRLQPGSSQQQQESEFVRSFPRPTCSRNVSLPLQSGETGQLKTKYFWVLHAVICH